MRYLLDTCAVSELVARQPRASVIDWLDARDPSALYLSAITIGELAKGIAKLPDSSRRRRLRAWLDDELPLHFAGRILPVDTDVMLTWGQLIARLEASGRPMAPIDSLIAAIALHHSLRLVTRNVDDFAPAGVQIDNPWA